MTARPEEHALDAEPARTVADAHVVVIVLNWCGEDDTAECLESLARCDWPRLTVLLVDTGSPDGSGARLHARFPELPYLQTGANLGYTGGNNRGFEWALAHGADHVVVLNNDTVVEPDLIARLPAPAGGRRRPPPRASAAWRPRSSCMASRTRSGTRAATSRSRAARGCTARSTRPIAATTRRRR